MAFLLHYLKVPLSWPEILRRTFSEAFWKDNCLAMAAQLAYGAVTPKPMASSVR